MIYLGVQTELMKLILSFHPAWLIIGLEVIFNTWFQIGCVKEFTRIVANFVMKNLFFCKDILKNKHFIGREKYFKQFRL